MSKSSKEVALKIRPFLKWAGGKQRIVYELRKKMPKDGKRFIEPFFGGGSVSLNVEYPEYIVNDTNPDLMSVWKTLRTTKMVFVEECNKLFTKNTNCETVFNKFKQEFNETHDRFRKATLFVYLNRHCYNGLCRYNSNGEYNASFGKYDEPYFPIKEFEECIEKSKKFVMHNKDFREIFDMIKKDDVVYCDPPYLPASESANFDGYSFAGFSLKDHLDLAGCAKKVANRGATVIISNHYNWYSRELYKEMFGAKISKIDVSRPINSDTSERKSVSEIIAIFS